MESNTSNGNPRAASTRIGSCTAKTLAGQIRHDLRRGPQPNYVDGSRAHLNRILMEPLTTGQMRLICENRRKIRNTERAIKSNSAVATRGIITFGSEAARLFERLSCDQQDAAFHEVAQAVADRLNTSLHSLVVHVDEATIHAHYQLAAYDRSGYPISKSTSPRVLSELQDLTATVMARHCAGIERGNRYGDRLAGGADWADVIHKSVHELHRSLPADLAAKRVEFEEAARAVAEKKAKHDEMTEHVLGLEMKAELNDKEVKRLEVYRHRLQNRLKELEAALQASESARIEVDRLSKISLENATAMQSKTDAVKDALESLALEVSNRSISRNSETKRIRVADLDKLKAAVPTISPAVNAAADLVESMRAAEILSAEKINAAEASVEKDRAEVNYEKAEIKKNWTDILEVEKGLRQEKRSLEAWTIELFQNTIIVAQHFKLALPANTVDGLKSLKALAVRLMAPKPSRSEQPEPPTSDGPGF